MKTETLFQQHITIPIMNRKKTYAIVDSKGKIIEPFRTKQAARQSIPKIRENRLYEEVELVKLKKPKSLNIDNI